MRITSSKNGKQKITISRKEWETIGKKAGWKIAYKNNPVEFRNFLNYLNQISETITKNEKQILIIKKHGAEYGANFMSNEEYENFKMDWSRMQAYILKSQQEYDKLLMTDKSFQVLHSKLSKAKTLIDLLTSISQEGTFPYVFEADDFMKIKNSINLFVSEGIVKHPYHSEQPTGTL